MVDPASIMAGAATAKAGIAVGRAVMGSVKDLFHEAEGAMNDFREMAEAGVSAATAMGSLIKIFTAQGKIRRTIEESKTPPDEDDESGLTYEQITAMAMEAMMHDRKMRDWEKEIKDYLIYSFNEPGLYQQLCDQRDSIVYRLNEKQEAKRRAETERVLQIKRVEMEKRRKWRKKVELVQSIVAGIVMAAVIVGFAYGLWWMFQMEGKL
jgi:hypothetical protein